MKKPEKKNQVDDSGELPGPILIKKYPNRRLYNTATSSYIVLNDVVELVRSGAEFIIEDTKTGEDLTRSILNQIIYEQEIKPDNFHFPLEFQKQLISMYGDTYGQMVPNYLTESLNLFAAERTKIRDTFGSTFDSNTRAMMEFSQNLASQNMELFRRSMNMFGMMGASGSKDENEEANSSDVDSKEDELEDIQKKIDALQQRLKSLK